MRLLTPLPLFGLCISALAQSIVVPNANDGTRGSTSLNTLLRPSGSAATYMLGIDASELGNGFVGMMITGISFRAATGANTTSWPPSETAFANYSVSIGGAKPLASWTTTLASNFFGAPATARGGSMVIEAKTVPALASVPSPQPNAFSEFYWDFQNPYTYTGGSLAVLITHGGSSQATSTCALDAVPSTSKTVAYSSTSYQAASGAQAAFCVLRVHFGFGAGCAGTDGRVPNLVLSSNVYGGGSATFAAANCLANAPAAFALGTHSWAWLLPNGCLMYHDATTVVPLTMSQLGRAKISGSFPAGLYGSIYCQMFVLDPAAQFSLAGSLAGHLLVWP